MVHLVEPGADPAFPDHLEPDADGLAALGGDLTCATVCEAYAKGLFPWTGAPPIPWFSPDPRLILPPHRFRASRSLRKTLRQGRFEVRFDADFTGTMRECAAMPRPGQPGTWITPNMIDAYSRLHRRGIAHSVEAYRDGVRVGGLYGLTFGAAFFGESMFARQADASKVALAALCARLGGRGFAFIDCQQVTRHLLSLGAIAVPRAEYLRRLRAALTRPSAHESWR